MLLPKASKSSLSTHVIQKQCAHVHYCGYKYTSTKPQSLPKFFTDVSSIIIGFMLCAKLDTNSIVMLVSFWA